MRLIYRAFIVVGNWILEQRVRGALKEFGSVKHGCFAAEACDVERHCTRCQTGEM